MSIKHGNDYKELFLSPTLDWCQLMKDKKSNRLSRFIIDLMKKDCPSLLHKCPYAGPLTVMNLKPSKTMFTFLPTGIYRVTAKVTGSVPSDFIYVSILLEIKNF